MIDQRRKDAETKVAEDPNRAFEILRLEEKAESERRRGEFDLAISSLSEAMTIRMACTEKLKAAGQDASSEIAATVRLLHTFGRVYEEKGDEERAKRAHRDALRLFKKNAPAKLVEPQPTTLTTIAA
jgi:Flp pilus assembly protein TadD